MLGRTDSRGRLLLLFLVLTLLSSGMVMRLAYWQINQHERLTALAGGTSTVRQSLPAKRGTIYDRTGTIVLAETIYRYNLIADLHSITTAEREREADALVDYLDLTGDAEATLRKAMTGSGYYVTVATNVDADAAKEIAQGQAYGALSAITLDPTPVRVYPQAGGAPHTSLAAQMLGFVNASGRGQYGLEQKYDALLAGRPEVVQIDPNRPGPAGTTVVDRGAPGVGHPHDDRRRPPAPGRAGGLRYLDRRQGQDGVGDRDGPEDRSRPGRGELPLVRRESVRAGRRPEPVAIHGPGHQCDLRAGLRLQDAHRFGGSRDQDHRADHEDQRLRRAQTAGWAGGRRCRPQGDGLDDLRRHRGLVSQRRRLAGGLPSR